MGWVNDKGSVTSFAKGGKVERIEKVSKNSPTGRQKYKKERSAKNQEFKRKVAKTLGIAVDAVTGGVISNIKLVNKYAKAKKRRKSIEKSI